jgi:hypothetical protein
MQTIARWIPKEGPFLTGGVFDWVDIEGLPAARIVELLRRI